MRAPRLTAISAARRSPMAASAGSAPTSSSRCARHWRSELTEAVEERLRLYGRRHGRKLRSAQQDLLDDLLPRIAVPADGPIADPAGLFDPRAAAVWLEIGFGGGEHLAA